MRFNFGRSIPSPSQLNFFAGLFAGAGINMLTSVSSSGPGQPSNLKLVLDSVFWVLAAGFLTWAAHILEDAEREAALFIDRTITDNEKREIRQAQLQRASPKARVAIALTGLSVLAAVILLPGLIDWSKIFA